MKKTYYIKPVIEIVNCVPASVVMTSSNPVGGGTEEGDGSGSGPILSPDAKDRAYEEDNEAFNVTGGSGMASFGDLW